MYVTNWATSHALICLLLVLLSTCYTQQQVHSDTMLPLVINTWNFLPPAQKAWDVLHVPKGNSLDAVEAGISLCEQLRPDGSVGPGNHPDESGEVTQDAMLMHGPTHDVGSVVCLRRVKSAVSVARKVLDNTKHSILAGELATQFARQMGFEIESLASNDSTREFNEWKKNNCQPNFWKNTNNQLTPDPSVSCGPYTEVPGRRGSPQVLKSVATSDNHDTIGMIAIDQKGEIVAGTSTNGYNHKIPGRVADSALPGSGAYVDQEVGAACATGDGDTMMRLVPSYQAVESMRLGMSPDEAASDAIRRITKKCPSFAGAVIAVNRTGSYAAACHGLPGGEFPYAVARPGNGEQKVKLEKVKCI